MFSTYVLVCCLMLAGTIAIDWALAGTDPWTRWGSAYDPGPFCERERTMNFLREPMNSLSDYAFMLVGFYMFHCYTVDVTSRRKPRHGSTGFLQTFPEVSLVAAVMNCAHAAGSFTNHACRCHLGHQLDVILMWSAVFTNLAMVFGRVVFTFAPPMVRGMAGVGSILSILVGLVAFIWVGKGVRYPHSYKTIEPALVYPLAIVSLAGVVILRFAHGLGARHLHPGGFDTPTFVMALLCIAVGALCGRLDSHGIVCWPDSFVQLHAVWHILAAGALGLCYHGVRG